MIINDFQVVHCHLKYSWIFAIFICICTSVNNTAKFIFHEHDPEITDSYSYGTILKFAVKFGTVVSVSDFMKQILMQYNISEDIIITLRNFVDTNRFIPKPKSSIGHNAKKVEVGFIGRLVKRKGWEDILELAQILKNQNVIFKVIGSGENENLFKRSIKENLLEEVIILEGSSFDMPNTLHSIDLLVMPSSLESSGLIHIEAQACGVPVIAYDIPGVNEMISYENSILVPLGDVGLMAKKILGLINDPNAYNKLVDQGLINAKAHSIDSYIPLLAQIYSK